MALVNQIIDFIDDIGLTILKTAAADAPVEFMTAKILTGEDREKLTSDQFALVMRTKEAQELKKFPVVDKANTWLSCQYFEKTSEQLPFVAQKIAASQLKKACLFYGLKIPDLIEKTASNEMIGNKYDETKNWKKDKEHMQSVKIAEIKHDGSSHFYALAESYAMPNSDYVKKAAAYFSEHFREFTDAEDRSVFAENVKARAKELNVALEKNAEELLHNYAGKSYGDSIISQINLRQEILQHKPEMSEALSKLASHRVSTDPQVFARVLYQFDKKAGLSKYYDGYIADAFKSTFGTFSKVANKGYSWEDEQSGLSINGESLEKAANDKYDRIKAYFGPTLADSLKKHAVEIFDSLPKDAKETVIKISKGAL